MQIGREIGTDTAQGTHPKARDRAAAIIDCFRQYFDVNYHPDGNFDLAFTLREKTPEAHAFSGERVENAYSYAKVLEEIWVPVKDRLLQDFLHKRSLHPLWQ